jgi:hypothetical protein
MKINTVAFLSLSQLGLSNKGKQSLIESSEITFGDGNYTLITLIRIYGALYGTVKDHNLLRDLMKQYGDHFCVDMES